ncbi:MAG: AMP-binding protein [Pseudomonadota bacterium]
MAQDRDTSVAGASDWNPLVGGQSVGVAVANSVDFVETMLGNLRQGLVSAPFASDADRRRLDQAGIREIVAPGGAGGWLTSPFTSEAGDAPAHIALTSGTQGAPKAVLLSRGNLHDVVSRVTDAMAITSDIREYVGVPVHHSFGYGRCRTVLNAGGAVYIPGDGFDLIELKRLLLSGEVNAISAVPSLVRLLLAERAQFNDALRRVRWVEIGSQYLAGFEKSALCGLFPEARIVSHYGLTEASRTALQRIDGTAPEALDSIGQATGAVDIRIGDRGRIETRGPHVALAVLDDGGWRPAARDGWLETSDRGHIDDGLLYFDGRDDDVINCGGVKLSPEWIETCVRRLCAAQDKDAGDFALVRQDDPIRGDRIGLVVTPSGDVPRDMLVDMVDRQLALLGVRARDAISVHELPALPKTSGGKVQRSLLRDLIRTDRSTVTETEGSFADLLRAVLGRPFDPEQSFTDVGGDSLSHLQLVLALEKALDEVPVGWEWWPLQTLIATVEDAGDYRRLMGRSAGAPPLPDGMVNANPAGLSLRSLIREDFRANGSSIFSQGFLMLLVHRFGNWRMGIRWRVLRMPLSLLYRLLNKLTQILFGMKLDYTVKVGRRVRLEHFGGMILGARAIGDDVVVRQNTTFGIRSVADLNAKPTIGNGVDIGAGAVIVGNIVVGDHSVIGANSVVYTNIPPYSVVMGVPARVIGKVPHRTAPDR